jgi:hypothetical protein
MSGGGLASQDDGGSSSGNTTSSSGSGTGTSSGTSTDDASDPLGSLDGAAASLDGSGGHPLDGAPQDSGVDSGSICSHLNTCCTWLQQYGTSAMTVTSCQQTATSGNESSCAFLLGTLESSYLCLGA